MKMHGWGTRVIGGVIPMIDRLDLTKNAHLDGLVHLVTQKCIVGLPV